MNKKTASIILIILDIFSLWGFWIGGHDFHRILTELHNHIEVIDYMNRISFLIVGIGLPIIHIIIVIEFFRPSLIHKHNKVINWGIMVLVVGLISGSIIGSFYLTYRIKSAGYVYCRKANGISALARSVVYTINDDVCEEEAATQPRRY